MNEAQVANLAVKGLIAGLPKEERAMVAAAITDLRDLQKKHGEAGGLAILFISTEIQAEEDE